MLRKTLFLTVILGAIQGFTKFIPDEDIKEPYRIYSERDANMTEADFLAVIAKAEQIYAPIVSSHGGRLVVNARWTDNTLNASASQSFGSWNVNMYGGLARHPDMTLDGFAMVLCHELGHHLAGFSFKTGWGSFGGVWAANEGQSDYFAAHSCSRVLWHDETDKNAEYRETVLPIVQQSCDAVWSTIEDQNLCYRVNAAGDSLARVLAALRKDPIAPAFETPDSSIVTKTDSNHPKAQCRLDTTYAASLCVQEFDISFIPGKKLSDQHGLEAEREAANVSCAEVDQFTVGVRPRCWYKPNLQ